ncbi:hypothetical protein CYR75_05250 [Paracoccus jeotgali]|uniref:Uncharacterized protein n=1 Tax=Paracoccus jeotgali TaxID=2065379 RepID=A0A2K9MDQ6_9RHOB|nr:hypothetical protein CYR75_05250 [Paracoccus jeotgali]
MIEWAIGRGLRTARAREDNYFSPLIIIFVNKARGVIFRKQTVDFRLCSCRLGATLATLNLGKVGLYLGHLFIVDSRDQLCAARLQCLEVNRCCMTQHSGQVLHVLS